VAYFYAFLSFTTETDLLDSLGGVNAEAPKYVRAAVPLLHTVKILGIDLRSKLTIRTHTTNLLNVVANTSGQYAISNRRLSPLAFIMLICSCFQLIMLHRIQN